MNLEEAKHVILSERDGRAFRSIQAASIICSNENTGSVSIGDLISCLKRGNDSPDLALVGEYAALALYRRTGRPRKTGHLPYEDFVTDANDWSDYLNGHGLL